MNNSENWKKLIEKLDGNYNAYMQDLHGMSSIELIEKADEITAAKLVYSEFKNCDYGEDYAEYLLKFKNPLEVVRDAWVAGLGFSVSDDMACVIGNIIDKRDTEQDYELEINEASAEPAQGMEMQ